MVLGCVSGALAGLNSLGFVLLWRTTRLVNLAQPALGLVGGVLVGMLVHEAHWNFWFALPLGLLVGTLLALFCDRIVLRRLQEAPRAVLLVATVGLAGILSGLASAVPFIFRGALPTYHITLGITWTINGAIIFGPHILALVAFVVALVALYRFLHHSRLGLAALALGQDAERARALGVPAPLVRSTVWVVAGILSTVSGVLIIPIQGFSLSGGVAPTVLLLALAPAVLAGFRSLTGAAAAAIATGIVYQSIIYNTTHQGLTELILALLVLVAFAIQRRRIGRAEVATRASSWEAAATPRPLPYHMASSPGVGTAFVTFAAVIIAAAIVGPSFVSPGSRVLYATSSAMAIGVLSIAVAWMFAGEIALGHWGLAGMGAWLAAHVHGPIALRAVVAALVLGAVGALLGLISRRRSSLAFPVLGLAAAAAAPILLVSLHTRGISTEVAPIGSASAVIAILTAMAIWRLRKSDLGVRMVAARDDPARAPWLGAQPLRERIIALTISCALAGLAGALYLASVPAGIPPGVFDARVSLDLLAIGVIGGLGSVAGALAGAGVMLGAQYILPEPWRTLANGTGVLFVVILRPAGLSGAITAVRDAAVRILGPAKPSAPQPPVSPAKATVGA
ncbi:MAG: hypothetical protein ABR548_07930 [Actinomycetota bacterium]|nr:ABC transporter permease [Actinomycetota bacterium]